MERVHAAPARGARMLKAIRRGRRGPPVGGILFWFTRAAELSLFWVPRVSDLV